MIFLLTSKSKANTLNIMKSVSQFDTRYFLKERMKKKNGRYYWLDENCITLFERGLFNCLQLIWGEGEIKREDNNNERNKTELNNGGCVITAIESIDNQQMHVTNELNKYNMLNVRLSKNGTKLKIINNKNEEKKTHSHKSVGCERIDFM